MSNHFVLSASTIGGGVYNSKNGTYTFFLLGGCCIVPEDDLKGTEPYERFKDVPEEFISDVMMHGLNTSISSMENTTSKKTLNNKTINNKYLKLD